MAEVAEVMGKSEVDALCDLLLDEDLQTSYVSPGPNLATLPDFMTHPLTMIGTDGLLLGDFPSPRTYGTFPTILSHYVREERLITLAEAIRKMTSFAAVRLGIPDRGILRDGMKADIVVFDPTTVRSPATRHQPRQFPTGIEHVSGERAAGCSRWRPHRKLAGSGAEAGGSTIQVIVVRGVRGERRSPTQPGNPHAPLYPSP